MNGKMIIRKKRYNRLLNTIIESYEDFMTVLKAILKEVEKNE